MRRRMTARRVVALSAALAVWMSSVSTGAVAAQDAGDEAPAPEWLGPDPDEVEPWSPEDDPVAPPVEDPAAVPLATSVPGEAPTAVHLPEPASAEVTLGRSGAAQDVAGTPIEIAAGGDGVRGEALQVEVLDRAAAKNAGVSGFVFRLAGADGTDLADADGSLPVEVAIDYAAFEDLHGADWPDRMLLVALPECALEAPAAVDCPGGVPVPTRLDREQNRVVAEVDDLRELDASAIAASAPDLSDIDLSGVDVTLAEDGDATEDGQDVSSEPAPADEGATVNPAGANTDASPETTTTTAAPATTTTAAAPATTDPVTTASDPETTAAGEEDTAETVADDPTSAPTGESTTTAEDPEATTTTAAEPASTTTTSEPAEEPAPGDPATTGPEPTVSAPSGGVVLALTSETSGEGGDFAATPLGLSADWQVGVGSGEFSWSYPFGVPSAPAGATPEVALSYSSGSVDGMVSTQNTQAPQNGVGWADFAGAFIERRYWSCTLDGRPFGDLCWRDDNATISLAGRASPLVRLPNTSNQWVLKDDPRWKVEKLTGASNDDDNGEHWRVTTPDGTEYWFGLTPQSVFYVPVFSEAGEPCASPSGSALCDQAWRWNLEKVVDPNGNATTYTYLAETNHYKALGGFGGIQPYERAGRLQRIDYGANGPQGPVARVEFGAQYRCTALDDTCPPGTPGPGAEGYPDVPTDLQCTASACAVESPSFFSAKRYSSVTTRVKGAVVDRWNLNHDHIDDGEGHEKLHLISVQRVDPTAPETALLPPVELDYTPLPNRLDTAGGAVDDLTHFRLAEVVNEFGGTVAVTYGQQSPCIPGEQSGIWDNNYKDCFPQWWTPDEGEPGFAEFDKYLVTDVTETDGTANGTPVVTSYDYGDPSANPDSLDGGAAWHDDSDEYVPDGEQSWADWRGYGTATVTRGDSVTRTRVFRGMHQDSVAGGGTKDVDMTALDGPSPIDKDWHYLQGRVLDQAQLAGGVTERGVLHDYTEVRRLPAGESLPFRFDEPYWVGESEAVERRRAPGGVYATRRTTTSYNLFLLSPEEVTEHGWDGEAGDERCTRTDYAVNTSAWMLDYPKATTLYGGTSCSGDELRRSETAYDGGGYGTAPTEGNPTASRTKLSASPAAWSETLTGYDALGRPTQVTDPNGNVTTTAYAPATGYPTSTTVTKVVPGDDDHVTTTDWLVARQAPDTVADPNGNVTAYGYDGLGRVSTVHQPTEPVSGPASWQFVYDIDPDKAQGPVVRTRRLQSTGPDVYVDSWVVYDGLARERQTHRMSPAAGKTIVTDTAYDARGLANVVASPEAVDGTPGSGLLAAPAAGWANRTQTVFDALERPFWEVFWAKDSQGGDVVSRSTVTSYTHNTVTVDPHVGGDVRTVTDAYDRPVQVTEHDGTAWQATDYAYNLAGDLVSVTDPEGHEIRYGYDLAGRRVGMDDPDAGSTADPATWGWTYGYDPAGNQTRVTDARGTAVFTNYDALNRPVERREGDPAASGELLASWDYDAAGELGLLDKSYRWQHTDGQPSAAYIVDVSGYDARNRPTGRSWTVFASDVPGLAGTHEVGYAYDRADHVTVVGYPQVGDPQNGGLPAEWVVTEYNSLGLPVTLGGTLLPADEDYATAAGGWGYDDRARPQLWLHGPVGQSSQLLTLRGYDADQRLSHLQADAAGNLVQDHQLAFDPVGNVVEDSTYLGSDKVWRECYGYDDRHRLTDAYTVAAAEDCATGTPGGGSAGFGYDHAYDYSLDGNLLERREGTDTYTYSYPTGDDQPHAPTGIDGPAASGDWGYTWDANGHQDTRTNGGTTNTLVWSPDRLLDQIQEPNGNVKNSFVYDADGQRMVRRHVDGATVYIEGHELNANNSGAQINVVRTYSLEGTPVATRTAQGVQYLLADEQGSVELTVPTGATTPAHIQAYEPYGARRTSADPATDQGWIGQIEDTRTGLNYLNARYYDPVMARFLAPDPLYDQERPQSINPYQYGLNNPTTNSDPTGLCVPVLATDGGACVDARWSKDTNDSSIAAGIEAQEAIEPQRTGSSYSFTFDLQGYADDAEPRDLLNFLVERCADIFPVDGCDNSFEIGDGIRLTVDLGPYTQGAPLTVDDISEFSFEFIADEGHPEGGGRHIEFKFIKYNGAARLRVTAWGPGSAAVNWPGAGWANAEYARQLWESLANNVSANYSYYVQEQIDYDAATRPTTGLM